MKKYLSIAIISFLIVFLIANQSGQITRVYGQEEIVVLTPAETSDSGKIDNNIKKLKEKIASKVAELSKNNKKISVGVLVKKDEDNIELETRDKKTLKIIIDNSVTKFYSLIAGVKKEIRFADFTKDDFILAAGPLIENVVNANAIYKTQDYLILSGKIIDVDKEGYVIKVLTNEKDEYTLDIEKTTKQLTLDTTTFKITPIGFSKLKQDDWIHFTIQKNAIKENKRASALRILTITSNITNKEK